MTTLMAMMAVTSPLLPVAGINIINYISKTNHIVVVVVVVFFFCFVRPVYVLCILLVPSPFTILTSTTTLPLWRTLTLSRLHHICLMCPACVCFVYLCVYRWMDGWMDESVYYSSYTRWLIVMSWTCMNPIDHIERRCNPTLTFTIGLLANQFCTN